MSPSVFEQWDELPDSPITPEQAHAVAAHWRNTTQLSNALDAAAYALEQLESERDRAVAALEAIEDIVVRARPVTA